jgi:CTP synthase (UTP-ammonia lyase)
MAPDIRVAIVGDFNSSVPAHRAIPEALRRAAEGNEHFGWEWIETVDLSEDPSKRIGAFHGLWCVPASPYANPGGVLDAIHFARETGRPFLGTCGGFQHALLEFARAFWGIASPAHAETDPHSNDPVISALTCGLVEETGELHLVPGSKLAGIYGAATTVEQYNCRYGLNPQYRERLKSGPLRVAAVDAEGDVRAVELEGHPFFVATLFQPERSALAGQDHPLIRAFVGAARERARNSTLAPSNAP